MVRRYLVRFLTITSLLLLTGAGVGLVAFQARGGRLLSIQSNSMSPSMQKGGLVGVMPVSESQLRIGDVITFINPTDNKTTVTHRVTALDGPAGENITTKGDANPAADEPISDALLVGREQFYVPWLGLFLDFVRQPVGLLLLIYIPALTVIAAEVRKLAAYYKSMEPYILPEFASRKSRRRGVSFGMVLPIVSFVLASILVTGPANALLSSSVISKSSSLSTAALSTEPDLPDLSYPEPVPTTDKGSVVIRRAFVACSETDDTEEQSAEKVEVVLYNSSKQSVDISGWRFMADETELGRVSASSIIKPRSTFDYKLPIEAEVSYSSGSLVLMNRDNEQINEFSWKDSTTGDRECRTDYI